jgi:hypothetical protein
VDTNEALSEAPPDVMILLCHEAMLMNGDVGGPAAGRMRTEKDDARVPARQEDDRSKDGPDEPRKRKRVGTAERLVDAALAVDFSHRDKKYAAPVSELPDTPMVIRGGRSRSSIGGKGPRLGGDSWRGCTSACLATALTMMCVSWTSTLRDGSAGPD